VTIKNSSKNYLSPLDLSELCALAGDAKKAKDILVLDVGAIIGIAEYFVVLSGSNDRQVKAISDSILKAAHECRITPISVEGQREGEWILLDFGTVVAHVFLEEFRNYYRIERLFKDAQKIQWRTQQKRAG